jgi:superfamily II DNA or RNA helicase
VIVDEAHSTGSDTVFEVLAYTPAYFRFGLSATPLDRTDGANLRLLGMTGPLLIDIRNKTLVDKRVLPWAQIVFSKVTAPVLKKRIPYATAYKTAVVENENAHQIVLEWAKVFTQMGLSTMILVENISHGKRLDELLWNEGDDVFIPHKFIHGSDSGEDRDDAIEAFGARRLPVLICSMVADQGLDVSTVDALILAGSRKSRIKTMQRLGRGLRGDKLIVVELANYCSDYLLRHSLERLEDYKEEDCFGIYQSQPSMTMAQKLWELQETRLKT